MAERASDHWVSLTLSILLHGGLAAVVVYGFWTFRQSRPPAPTLAIEATVVDARSLNGAQAAPPQPQPPAPVPTPAPAPAPEPEPAEPTGPPEPTPEELAQREEAQKEQAQKEQQQQEQADRDAAQKQHKLEEQKQQEQAQRQAEEERQQKQREQEKAEADRKATEARKRAEDQRVAEQKRAEAVQRQADEKNRAEREAELQSSLAAEEHAIAARNSGAVTSWVSQITARIQRAWLRPPSARAGVQCVLHVTQAPGGTVTNVRIGECNGDQAVRESIEAAVYRASPLPPPPDPSLFERDLEITFRPD
jgi:colicin import membrane protein